MFSCKFLISSDILSELDDFIANHDIDNVSVFENTQFGFSSNLDQNGFPVAKFFDVEIYTENTEYIEQLLKERFGDGVKFFTIQKIDDKDWVNSYLKELKPVICDKFYFYNEFTQAKPANQELIPIKLNSALAFGSGHHQTTQACLLNMRYLLENRSFHPQDILDMGCGTGILGICALKIWNDAKLLGVDMDPESVRITEDNYRANKISAKAICEENLEKITDKFDLIFCNILKQPLINLCSEFVKAMNSGAYIITSGYIITQENELTKYYINNKFKIKHRIQADDWVSIIFQRQ